MSLQAVVTVGWAVSGTDAGGGTEQGSSSISVTLPNSPALVTNALVQNGTNSVVVPSPAPSFVLVIPPTGSTVTKKWSNNAGAGGDLHTAQPSLLAVAAGATNIYFAANGAETLRLVWL